MLNRHSKCNAIYTKIHSVSLLFLKLAILATKTNEEGLYNTFLYFSSDAINYNYKKCNYRVWNMEVCTSIYKHTAETRNFYYSHSSYKLLIFRYWYFMFPNLDIRWYRNLFASKDLQIILSVFSYKCVCRSSKTSLHYFLRHFLF